MVAKFPFLASFDLYRRHHRHAGYDGESRRYFIENYFDWNALDHLDIVSSGIFRREEAEIGSTSGLYAVDATLKNSTRVSIHLEGDLLPGTNTTDLSFLKVSGNEDFVRQNHEERLTRFYPAVKLSRWR